MSAIYTIKIQKIPYINHINLNSTDTNHYYVATQFLSVKYEIKGNVLCNTALRIKCKGLLHLIRTS